MQNPTFKTTREVAEDYHMSEVSQWRYRAAGELEYYRIAGKILYSPQQLSEFFESRRVGSKPQRLDAMAA